MNPLTKAFIITILDQFGNSYVYTYKFDNFLHLKKHSFSTFFWISIILNNLSTRRFLHLFAQSRNVCRQFPVETCRCLKTHSHTDTKTHTYTHTHTHTGTYIHTHQSKILSYLVISNQLLREMTIHLTDCCLAYFEKF